MITVKTPEQIQKMREAGKIVAGVLEELEKHVKPGISTLELDKIAHDYIIKHGAKPSFLHYHGFPASICSSVACSLPHLRFSLIVPENKVFFWRTIATSLRKVSIL